MGKIIQLLCICMLLTATTSAQLLTLSDVKAIAAKSTDEVAERLIEKGFEADPYPRGKYFEYKKGGQSLGINFKDNDPNLDYKLVTVCYPTVFNTEYSKLLSQIKAVGKKKSFFYSTYNVYMTEYVIAKNVYVYLCKGFCESLDHKTQYNAFFISNESLQEKLK